MRHSGSRLYFRLLREARSYWMAIAGLLLLQIVAIPLKLLMPVPLKIVVDNVLGSQPVPGVLKAFPALRQRSSRQPRTPELA